MAGDTPKKKGKAKWIILIVLLLLLGGGSAGAWFFLFKGISLPFSAKTESEQPAEAKQTRPPVTVAGTSVPLSEFTTNLADPLGQRFIRISIEVEVADQTVVAEMTRLNARIRDSIILLLSSKTYADVAGAENKIVLKSEVTERLNNILGAGKIYQVFITNMVIQ